MKPIATSASTAVQSVCSSRRPTSDAQGVGVTDKATAVLPAESPLVRVQILLSRVGQKEDVDEARGVWNPLSTG